MALLLFTGARRQDMVTLGRQHVKGEWLQYVPKKTLRVRREASRSHCCRCWRRSSKRARAAR
ncbi:MAG: hypothetical protein MZV49_12210 [Rhodopseudomonas palustris]|nr:hypothetical protein [Rhodopseudomonas palustris]